MSITILGRLDESFVKVLADLAEIFRKFLHQLRAHHWLADEKCGVAQGLRAKK